MELLPKFTSLEEEVSYLRSQVEQKEKQLAQKSEQIDTNREQIVSAELNKFVETPSGLVGSSKEQASAHIEKVVLDLDPEDHDSIMAEMIRTIKQHGILHTISAVQKMNNPHLLDDLHRFLVAYILAGMPAVEIKHDTAIWKALTHTLYSVHLPDRKKEDVNKALKEILSVMEQFYAGMMSVARDDNTFSIELANPNNTEEIVFFISVPKGTNDLFEKLLLSVFPTAKISLEKNDYNIFADGGAVSGGVLKLSNNPILPIKTYESFDYDPLNIVLNTFSKIAEKGEGASLQFVIKPAPDSYIQAYKGALDKLKKGVSKKEALDIRHTLSGRIQKDLGDAFGMLISPKKEKKDEESKPVDDILMEQIKTKISTPIALVNARLLISTKDQIRADAVLNEIIAAFNQFELATSNKINFEQYKKGTLAELCHDFSFRLFRDKQSVPLNIKELSTLMHFPSDSDPVAPTLRKTKSATAPAPINVPKEGILLGKNSHRGKDTDVYISPEDRLRHMYIIGQTGTGKTVLMKNMIIQDIKNGDGVCMIDPHGTDIQEVLANIPKERYEDVIYFDPAYTARPMGLNMLEYDVRFPEQKTFVVNELLGIFKKLYGAVPESMGPAFEQYFRNSALLVMEHPESGNTMVDISRVLSNKAFRELKLANCKNPLVTQFWRNAEKTTGEQGLANYVQYVSNKFDNFLSNEIMRPIVAQEKSAFNLRDIIDQKKILLVNLSKGKLGDLNANLIGLIIVGKILMATLSRVDSSDIKSLAPFYLYIDEFQNVTTDSISTILSEARKYRLGLIVAHQFIAQLEEGIKKSVFGNVGTMSVFRVGAEDAEFLKTQFDPIFGVNDIMNIPNYNAYLKLLADGKPLPPFNIQTMSPNEGNSQKANLLKEMSYLKYGADRAKVEEQIISKYKI